MIFKKRPSDLPFSKDAIAWFLPWMAMLMVFFATLTTAMTLSINTMLAKWTQSVSGSITIQILPTEGEDGIDKRQTRIETEEALSLLRKTSGVASANLLTDHQMQNLLRPWLGDSVPLEDLPLPSLIDVQLLENFELDLDNLKNVLKQKAPNASIDVHKKWLGKLIRVARKLDYFVSVLLALIISTTSIIVIYVSCSSLAVHKPVIELLHLIGAKDDYISKQYAIRTLILSSIGSVVGFVFVLPIINFFGKIFSDIQAGLLSEIGLTSFAWFLLILIPILTIILSTLTAYWTVQRTLRKLL